MINVITLVAGTYTSYYILSIHHYTISSQVGIYLVIFIVGNIINDRILHKMHVAVFHIIYYMQSMIQD